jgi:hypothetical protein
MQQDTVQPWDLDNFVEVVPSTAPEGDNIVEVVAARPVSADGRYPQATGGPCRWPGDAAILGGCL